MCNPWASSQIANEYKNNKEKFNSIQITSNVPQDPTWWKNPEILEHLLQIVRKAKYVNFSGGEPLAIPELTTVLENIPRDCLVQMTTNITLLTDKHIELFNNLDDMRLQISLDGVGAHHEYVRHGSKWDDIHNNVQKLFKNYKHQFDFSYLLQATSVYSFPNFYNYLKSIDKTAIVVVVKSNTLAENGIMTVNSVLPEDVEKFKTWHENNRNEYSDTIDTWLSYYNFNQEAHEHFKKYVTLLDEIRGCDFRTTFNPSW
jgi:sulfatase maturation enzyme AslB (radical SAM superfamily)